MAAQGVREVIPYAINFSLVVVLLAVVARKPVKKFLYQRHERMKDFLEDSARVHARASKRNQEATHKLAQLSAETQTMIAREISAAKAEAAEMLVKAKEEAERVAKEAQRLADAEASDSQEQVKSIFVDLVISQAEGSLKAGLKKDDHSAIIKRAQNSIEVIA